MKDMLIWSRHDDGVSQSLILSIIMMMMVICSMHSDYIDMGNDNDGKGEQQGHTNMLYFEHSKKSL